MGYTRIGVWEFSGDNLQTDASGTAQNETLASISGGRVRTTGNV
jgi:hypothetical protein